MKRVALAATTLLMLAGIAAGTLQSTPAAPAVPQQPATVLADTTAPPPLCDPTYTNCKWSTNVRSGAVK